MTLLVMILACNGDRMQAFQALVSTERAGRKPWRERGELALAALVNLLSQVTG